MRAIATVIADFAPAHRRSCHEALEPDRSDVEPGFRGTTHVYQDTCEVRSAEGSATRPWLKNWKKTSRRDEQSNETTAFPDFCRQRCCAAAI